MTVSIGSIILGVVIGYLVRKATGVDIEDIRIRVTLVILALLLFSGVITLDLFIVKWTELFVGFIIGAVIEDILREIESSVRDILK